MAGRDPRFAVVVARSSRLGLLEPLDSNTLRGKSGAQGLGKDPYSYVVELPRDHTWGLQRGTTPSMPMAIMQKTSKFFRLTPKDTIFLECDIQEKFRKLVQNGDSVIHNGRRLAYTAKIFQIPLISSAQLPKLFGPTCSEIMEAYSAYPEGVFRHEKSDFSMLEQPIWEKIQSLPERKNIVLYGIEAHVCVKQTCLDLLERDYHVTLVVDTLSSMSYHDRTVGIEAMRDAGAQITTYQSLVFELARSPSIPEYKELLKLIKDMPQVHIELHHKM